VDRGHFIQLLQQDSRGLPVESRPSFQTTRLGKSVEQRTMNAVDDMISRLSYSQLEEDVSKFVEPQHIATGSFLEALVDDSTEECSAVF
jgi:hypothetical protein